MFVGHAALALLVKARRPHPPTALLVAAAFGPDLLDWGFAAMGHHNRALSHSLIAVALGALAAAFAYAVLAKAPLGDALAVAGIWASHWPADFLTGMKPTWPGGPDVGLNLYAWPGIDLAMESALVLIAWTAYRRSVDAQRATRSVLLPLGLIVVQCAFAIALWGAGPLPARFDFLHLSR